MFNMDIILDGKVKKNCRIIQGFPGMGLVGTIATEFLVEHLKAKPVGTIKGHEIPPIAAIHAGTVVKPMGFFYAEKENILILHVISGVPGSEWDIAELLTNQAKKLNAKEIISLESVGTPPNMPPGLSNGFFYTNDKEAARKLERIGLEELKEGIVVGLTGALILNSKLPITCIFAETHSKLPDSKAAAQIVDSLSKYLGLRLDTRPLLKSAEEFEEKIRGILTKTKEVQEHSERNKLSYVG